MCESEIAREFRRPLQRDTGRSRLELVGRVEGMEVVRSCAAMLLHRPRCAGSIGRDELARRADQFAAGRTELINQARQTANKNLQGDAEGRGNAAQSRIQHGQVSRARHELTCARLAPKTEETLAKFQRTRPQEQRQISPDILEYRPEVTEFGQGAVRHCIAKFTIRERSWARRLHQRNAPRLLG